MNDYEDRNPGSYVPMEDNYVPSPLWNEKPRGGRSKWLMWGGVSFIRFRSVPNSLSVVFTRSWCSLLTVLCKFHILAIVGGAILIIGGVIAGIVVGTHKSSSKASSGGGSGGSTGTTGDGSDPSKFDKNPNLHNSFYGFAYTPLVRIRLVPVCAMLRDFRGRYPLSDPDRLLHVSDRAFQFINRVPFYRTAEPTLVCLKSDLTTIRATSLFVLPIFTNR